MSKKTFHTNFRVVVEPRGLGNWGWASVSDRMVCKDEADRQKQYRERCEDIAAEIKRHVDNVGSATVEYDEEGVCEHCGWRWTEESADYNGGCCQKDIDAHEAKEAA